MSVIARRLGALADLHKFLGTSRAWARFCPITDGKEQVMTNQDPDIRETHDLIASDMVVGTNVYDVQGNHIGQVERLILEKRGGRVSYAVLSFGGFFGIGDDYYPLPWQKLDYDESLGGFRIDITKEQVEGAPRYARDRDFDWTAESGRRVYDHYGIRPYWV
jgi:sporulation protein YlmC with PRC-barrel domain